MEVHAFVDGWVGDLPSLLEEVTPLAKLVHFDAHLRRRRAGVKLEKKEQPFCSYFSNPSHYLLTHQGDGVVHTAVDDLSSSSDSDTQRGVVPDAPTDSISGLQHHDLE